MLTYIPLAFRRQWIVPAEGKTSRGCCKNCCKIAAPIQAVAIERIKTAASSYDIRLLRLLRESGREDLNLRPLGPELEPATCKILGNSWKSRVNRTSTVYIFLHQSAIFHTFWCKVVQGSKCGPRTTADQAQYCLHQPAPIWCKRA